MQERKGTVVFFSMHHPPAGLMPSADEMLPYVSSSVSIKVMLSNVLHDGRYTSHRAFAAHWAACARSKHSNCDAFSMSLAASRSHWRRCVSQVRLAPCAFVPAAVPSSSGGFAPESRGGAVLVDNGGSLVMTNVAVEDCQAQVCGVLSTCSLAWTNAPTAGGRRRGHGGRGVAVLHELHVQGQRGLFVRRGRAAQRRVGRVSGLPLRGQQGRLRGRHRPEGTCTLSIVFLLQQAPSSPPPLRRSCRVPLRAISSTKPAPTSLSSPPAPRSSFGSRCRCQARSTWSLRALRRHWAPRVTLRSSSTHPRPPRHRRPSLSTRRCVHDGALLQRGCTTQPLQAVPLYTEYQPPPPPEAMPTPSVTVYSQDDLVQALLNNQPIIAVASHMVLTGGALDVRPHNAHKSGTVCFMSHRRWGASCQTSSPRPRFTGPAPTGMAGAPSTPRGLGASCLWPT